MDPGAYVDPLIRTTWVQVPMVSGYVGSRLRVADFAFGTSFSGAQGTNIPDNNVRVQVENAANQNAPAIGIQQGTNIYYKIQTTLDDGPSGTRSFVTGERGVVPLGRDTVEFYVNQPFLEILCTGGGGNIRAQVTGRLKWEEMAMDRTDKFGAPQLFNKKFISGGVVAPPPFPTS
jgi:hypothetical protein